MALWSRHSNVLEYKAGECGETEDMETLCDISPDTALNTMVRVDGDNIPCPIQVFDDTRWPFVHFFLLECIIGADQFLI